MKANAVVAALALASCAAPTQRSMDPTERMTPLPPASIRSVMGEWDLTDKSEMNHCTLSMVAGAYVPLLVQSCMVSTGCCNNTHGLPLLTIADGVEYEETTKRTYEIQPDRSLLIRETGQRLPPTAKERSLAKSWK